MSSPLEFLLDLHGDELLHAAPSGESVETDKDQGKKFDESKIKRDGRGKFARRQARMDAKIDDLWLSKDMQSALEFDLLMKATGDMKKLEKEYREKYNLPKGPLDYDNVPEKVMDKAWEDTIKILNETAKKHGVSPSGNHIIKFEPNTAGLKTKDKNTTIPWKAKVVPYSGPHPNPAARERQIGYIREANQFARSQKDNDGMRFNPDAKLDTSRVSDAGDSDNDSDDGWVSKLKGLFHSDEGQVVGQALENFLAHYGVKGMKWGVRRDRSTSSSSKGSKSSGSKSSEKESDDAERGSSSSGTTSSDVRLSADAERFVKAAQKPTHQMSDRELKETLARARMVEDYNKLFGSDPNKELQTKVSGLDLQKRYSQLKAELNPSRRAKAAALISSASAAYLAYKKLDKSSDGALSKNINAAFGNNTGGKHRKGA